MEFQALLENLARTPHVVGSCVLNSTGTVVAIQGEAERLIGDVCDCRSPAFARCRFELTPFSQAKSVKLRAVRQFPS